MSHEHSGQNNGLASMAFIMGSCDEDLACKLLIKDRLQIGLIVDEVPAVLTFAIDLIHYMYCMVLQRLSTCIL